MQLTGQDLVRLALSELADGSPAKLVRVLRLGEVLTTVDPAKAVARWRDGKNEPSYTVTIRLLDGLGMLREPEGSAAALPAKRRLSTDDRLSALEAEVAESVKLTKEALRLLREARRPTAGDPRAPQREKWGTGG